jgi:hypothetical protein
VNTSIKYFLIFTIIFCLSSVQFYSIFKLCYKIQEIEKIDIKSFLNCDEDSNEDIVDEVILYTKDSRLALYFIDLIKRIDFHVNQRLPSLFIKIDSPPPNFHDIFFSLSKVNR